MKICFAFLTKGSINNELFWFEYLNKFSNKEILIHCNSEPKFKYLNDITKNIYINSVETRWGRLQKVQNFLLEQCRLLECDKFIILSDSCLPIRSPEYLLNKINNNKSFIKNGDAWDFSRFPDFNGDFKLLQNHQWCIIDKRHYDIILNDEYRTYFEESVTLPEESFFSTIFEKNNINNIENVTNEMTTYVDWSRPVNSSPYTFEGTSDDIEHLNKAKMEDNIFFMRKIKDNIDSDFFNEIKKMK